MQELAYSVAAKIRQKSNAKHEKFLTAKAKSAPVITTAERVVDLIRSRRKAPYHSPYHADPDKYRQTSAARSTSGSDVTLYRVAGWLE